MSPGPKFLFCSGVSLNDSLFFLSLWPNPPIPPLPSEFVISSNVYEYSSVSIFIVIVSFCLILELVNNIELKDFVDVWSKIISLSSEYISITDVTYKKNDYKKFDFNLGVACDNAANICADIIERY